MCICIWSHTHVCCIARNYVPVHKKCVDNDCYAGGKFQNPSVKIKNRHAFFFNFKKFDFQRNPIENAKFNLKNSFFFQNKRSQLDPKKLKLKAIIQFWKIHVGKIQF